MLTKYDGVLKVDGDVGRKKDYDPRAWGKAAEQGDGRPRGARLRGPVCRPPHGLSRRRTDQRMEHKDLLAGPGLSAGPATYLPAELDADEALRSGKDLG